jgi:hypothetical protein
MTDSPNRDRLHAHLYDAIDAFQRTTKLPGLQHAQMRGHLADHLARVLDAEPERDACPSRFSATPAEIDRWMREHFAEDAYLRYQQAIGRRAVEDAVEDAQVVRRQADNEGLNNAAWREGWDDAIDRIDPDRTGDPYPSVLQCSRHNGFGDCPGAPWCTPGQDTPPGP